MQQQQQQQEEAVVETAWNAQEAPTHPMQAMGHASLALMVALQPLLAQCLCENVVSQQRCVWMDILLWEMEGAE